MTDAMKDTIRGWAREAGFDACGFTRASAVPGAAEALAAFVAAGRHGEMAWMEERAEQRGALDALWPEARSAVVLALNYGPKVGPRALRSRPEAGAISVYARRRDYHDVVKAKLKQVARRIHGELGAAVKVFVDTAPVMEKPLAEAAGLGWIGKHTNLVSREFGSWTFLGVIATALELEPDAPHENRCGLCRRCLDACPTDAFLGPRRIDARRCISYLTIEHKGPIPLEFRPLIGNRIYGCDDCLSVCPWNRFAQAASEMKLAARDDLLAPPLADLVTLDDAGFRALFSGSPVKRIGRARFVRNVLIAIGNGGDATMAEAIAPLLEDENSLVRGATIWALHRLLGRDGIQSRFSHMQMTETDPEVRSEWIFALSAPGA